MRTSAQSPSTLGRRTALALGLVMILFLALNLLSTNLSVGLRVDLTEKRLYTLSPATRKIIDRIEDFMAGYVVPFFHPTARPVRESERATKPEHPKFPRPVV